MLRLSSIRGLTSESRLWGEAFEHLANAVPGLDWMSKPKIEIHSVVVATTDALGLDVAAFVEFGEDPMHRSFRDPDEHRDLPLAQVAIAIQRENDVAMIGQKCPVLIHLLPPFFGVSKTYCVIGTFHHAYLEATFAERCLTMKTATVSAVRGMTNTIKTNAKGSEARCPVASSTRNTR